MFSYFPGIIHVTYKNYIYPKLNKHRETKASYINFPPFAKSLLQEKIAQMFPNVSFSFDKTVAITDQYFFSRVAEQVL